MKRTMKILWTAGSLLILLTLFIPGCRKNTPQLLDEPRLIKVGAILPLDGPWATSGKSANVALNLALGTLNTYLERYKLKIELVTENSSSDAGKALAAIKTLHAKGIRAVIGPMNSNEVSAVVDYANANGMMLVSPSSTAISLALPDNLFRMVPNDANQAKALANLMQHRGITHVLPVYLDDAYGRGLEQIFRSNALDPQNNIQVLNSVSYDVTVSDFSAVVKNITAAASGLDAADTAILLIGRDTDAVDIFSRAGVESPLAKFKWFSTDAVIQRTSILSNAQARAFAVKVNLEGYTFAIEATAPVIPTMLVSGLMSVALGETPSSLGVPTWDALWFIGEAYRLNPDAGTAEMMENFKSVVNNSGNSFGQMTKLDANGDMIPVRYACFAVEEISGTPRWNLKEMFVISTTLGIVTVDATSSMTRDTGDAFIGAVLPLTGVDSELGASAFKAINLALEHASNYYKLAEGLNINFKLEIRDSASDPATALAQVKSLHEMGINLLIGPTSNGELAAVREYVKANGIIILSTTSTASSLAMADDRILRLTPDDTRQAKALSRLMIAQNKQHIIVIYRNDRYGQESVMTFSGLFQGNIDRFAYETNDTDFSSVLKRAASRIQEIGTPGNTAVLVIGNSEIIKLLEQVPDGPLTSVDWYGTDGISKSRDLLASTRAVAVAEQTHLTCSTYDLAAMPYFVPQHYALETYITPLLKVPSTWNEISAYDALWFSASAFAMTSPNADTDELWNYLKNLYAATGIGVIYSFNENNDQTVSLYTFYTVDETSSGPAWKATAFYRDYFVVRDDLYIVNK